MTLPHRDQRPQASTTACGRCGAHETHKDRCLTCGGVR